MICVHAFSRFYRNGAEMELLIRKLRKHGVEVVSVTQPTGEASLASRRAEKGESLNSRVIALQREVTDAEQKLKRLYRLVEDGLTDLDEVLKDRLNTIKADRDRTQAALERAKEHLAPRIHIDPALIERFGRMMREHLTTGSTPFRKAYLRSVIDVIEVDDRQIRIKGSKDMLEKAVLASQGGQVGCSQMSTRWRARREALTA